MVINCFHDFRQESVEERIDRWAYTKCQSETTSYHQQIDIIKHRDRLTGTHTHTYNSHIILFLSFQTIL